MAISDSEYIVSARRVRELGLPLFDALNYSDGETIKMALAGLSNRLIRQDNNALVTPTNRGTGYSSGGHVSVSQNDKVYAQKVVLVCDGRELARAVVKGNKRILST